MKRWHLIAAIVAMALAVACTVGVMMAIQTSRPSTKEVEMLAEIAMLQEREKAYMLRSVQLRTEAAQKDATIKRLEQQLKTNKGQTNENNRAITKLTGDSLGGFVSDQLHYLHSAWY
jgi:uncharacterized protein HemX